MPQRNEKYQKQPVTWWNLYPGESKRITLDFMFDYETCGQYNRLGWKVFFLLLWKVFLRQMSSVNQIAWTQSRELGRFSISPSKLAQYWDSPSVYVWCLRVSMHSPDLPLKLMGKEEVVISLVGRMGASWIELSLFSRLLARDDWRLRESCSFLPGLWDVTSNRVPCPLGPVSVMEIEEAYKVK